MSLLVNTILGLGVGTLTALGGALKDSPYEGFFPIKLFRSIIVGSIGGAFSYLFTTSPLLVICFAGYFERFVVEGYKIIRAHKPGKFELKDPQKLGAKLSFHKEKING